MRIVEELEKKLVEKGRRKKRKEMDERGIERVILGRSLREDIENKRKVIRVFKKGGKKEKEKKNGDKVGKVDEGRRSIKGKNGENGLCRRNIIERWKIIRDKGEKKGLKIMNDWCKRKE